MKVRMKFTKTGPIRFVGHLDFMRYFTKAVARSGLTGVYTKGFSPHLILSFAAPLGVGEETLGDYADVELAYRDVLAEGDERRRLDQYGLDDDFLPAPPTGEEMCRAMNAVMAEGVRVTSCTRVGQTKASKAMALVRSASYEILLKDGFLPLEDGKLDQGIQDWYSQAELMIHKKTRKSEREVDIKPLLKEISFQKNAQIWQIEPFSKRKGYALRRSILIRCATGSTENLKPAAVLEALAAYLKLPSEPYGYQIVRTETYAEGGFALSELGSDLS